MEKIIITKLFDFVNISNSDITVKDESFYSDLLYKKTLGFGEGYMNNKFETQNLYSLCIKLQKINKLSIIQICKLFNFTTYIYFCRYIFFKFIELIINLIINPQSIIKSKEVAEIHYDLPNILYTNMLDETMLYSCAYFKNTTDLYTAQLQKIDLIISKLKLKDDDLVLDIGCGWGIIAATIAKRYPKVTVTGVSISKEQINYCKHKYNFTNLRFILSDYRDLKNAKFNKIYSIGMFEHVGYKNYNDFFNITYNLLRDDGIMLLHTICKHAQSFYCDPWFNKYIFPGGYLPSISQVIKVSESTNYKISDVQEFGLYYSETLRCWYNNFHENFNKFKNTNSIFDTKFEKMWKLYLILSKVGFDSNHLYLSQFVFTKNNKEVYIR